MRQLYFDGMPVAIEPKESVLDALLNAGHDIPYGCKSGACQSCMLMLEKGELPNGSQPGLTDTQKQMGYFLSCSCFPDDDCNLYIKSAEQALEKVPAIVTDKSFLEGDIIRLRLSASLYYQPGQYVTLWRDDHLARSYSIASVPALDLGLEFHIKRIENGVFSRWVSDELSLNDILYIQGPMGTCFYTAGNPEQPLLLAGMGTGLAPLYGIVRDALLQGHKGDIFLYIATRNSNNFYYVDELKVLETQHSNLKLKFVAQSIEGQDLSPLICEGDIYATIKNEHPSMNSYKVFLCGGESFVKKLKKQCFLSGAKMTDILADAFLPFGT